MNKGLVSIIVPIYNGEECLDRCLGSIINQSYNEIEALLIDDGSVDCSCEICNKYASKNHRIKIFHTKNGGPSAARNEGIKNSRGEFIFFLDHDDFIEGNAIELLIKSYNQYKAEIIIGDFNHAGKKISLSGNDNIFKKDKLMIKEEIGDYIKKYLKKPNRYPLFVYSWGRLFESSIIKKNNITFDENLRTFEDVAFNFKYLKYTDKIFFINQSLYNHQIYENFNSATMDLGDNPKKLFGYKKALESIKEFLSENKFDIDIDIKREIGHTDVCYTIIQLIRTCGQINENNEKKIYKFVKEIINEPEFRENLQFYSPTKGDSRILPMLMKLKAVKPIIEICKYKAYKRYKRNNKK